MLLGPGADGKFLEVKLDSIEVQRKAVQSLSAGETGAVLISFSTIAKVRRSSCLLSLNNVGWDLYSTLTM